jgi:hypothetical protein
VDIWTVSVLRWASTGAYDYTVNYRFHNTLAQPSTVTITDAVLLGPGDETLGGSIHSALMPVPETVGAGLYNMYRDLTVDDTDVSHPYAEKLRLRVSYQAGGVTGTAEAVAPVLHGPQTARLLDFSLSTQQPRVGESITVSWETRSARRVILQGTNQINFNQEVEPVGSRTFIVQRAGLQYFNLDVDYGQIYRTLSVVSQ